MKKNIASSFAVFVSLVLSFGIYIHNTPIANAQNIQSPTISIDSTSPQTSTVQVSSTTEGSYFGLPILIFDLNNPYKSTGSNPNYIYLRTLTINFQTSADLGTAYLYQGSTLMASTSVSNNSAVFRNPPVGGGWGWALSGGSTFAYTIKVDVKNVASGSSVDVKGIVDSSFVDFTNPSIGQVLSTNGSAVGNVITVSNQSGSHSAVQILSPNGGENLLVGQSYQIKWLATSSLRTVSISYETDKGAGDWIATNIPNTGTYNWTVKVGSLLLPQNVKINIGGHESYYPYNYDQASSTNYFVVTSTSTPPSLEANLDPISPVSSIVQISPGAQTNGVVLAVFDLRASVASTLKTLELNLNVSPSTIPINSLVSNLQIKVGNLVYNASSISSSSAEFTNLAVPLPANLYMPIIVSADIAPDSSGSLQGSNIIASIYTSTSTNAVDQYGDMSFLSTSTKVIGGKITFNSSLLNVGNISSTANTIICNVTPTLPVCYQTILFGFTLTANNYPLYVSAFNNNAVVLTTFGNIMASTTSFRPNSTMPGDTVNYYLLPAGVSRQFNETIWVTGRGVGSVNIDSIMYATSTLNLSAIPYRSNDLTNNTFIPVIFPGVGTTTVTVSLDPALALASTVKLSPMSVTQNVALGAFDLQATGGNAVLNSISFDLNKSISQSVTVPQLFNGLSLKVNGETYAGVVTGSIGSSTSMDNSGTVTFSGLSIPLAENATVPVTVLASINQDVNNSLDGASAVIGLPVQGISVSNPANGLIWVNEGSVSELFGSKINFTAENIPELVSIFPTSGVSGDLITVYGSSFASSTALAFSSAANSGNTNEVVAWTGLMPTTKQFTVSVPADLPGGTYYLSAVNVSGSNRISSENRIPFTIFSATSTIGRPIMNMVIAPQLLVVNQLGTWVVSTNDLNNNQLTYSISWGDGSNDSRNAAPGSISLNHLYSNAGVYKIIVTVTDGSGLSAQSIKNIKVIVPTGGGNTNGGSQCGAGSGSITCSSNSFVSENVNGFGMLAPIFGFNHASLLANILTAIQNMFKL